MGSVTDELVVVTATVGPPPVKYTVAGAPFALAKLKSAVVGTSAPCGGDTSTGAEGTVMSRFVPGVSPVVHLRDIAGPAIPPELTARAKSAKVAPATSGTLTA